MGKLPKLNFPDHSLLRLVYGGLNNSGKINLSRISIDVELPDRKKYNTGVFLFFSIEDYKFGR